MNPMVNMIIMLEKELEMERRGHRRTRRWIGDSSRVSDARWFQRVIHRISPDQPQSEPGLVAETAPRQAPQSTPEKSLDLARRRPACGEC